ncbi:quinolinate synthetase [Hydrogenispora ethanolica]|uniref:Quinolinate synthase n=1 Tax=Hydrogenispora ethanolica TaxID=1082276 RepID=A0A4R1RXY0_HYDET|nr:quinolinate synthase NadA [Hydrogenispora ethanolica]TCL71611.1 quinolinate synthetase [Hydrogenispora ethanolica]
MATDFSADIAAIRRLREARQALILAHNYQNDEIQDLADIVGDSLALSQAAAATAAPVIVFCGVHFMAESAAILSPDKTVLLPAETAGCPMAEMASADEVLRWRAKYPRAAVVAYVNSTAAVKAVSDYCCTSANAVKLVRRIPETELIFLPDQNLGRFVAEQVPEKTIHLWPGYCLTHHRVTAAELLRAKELHPDAPVLAHPECRSEVTALADFVGSTSQIIAYVREAAAAKFIIGTEMGIIHGLQQEHPGKTFYLLAPGLVCPNMKQTTVAKVRLALEQMAPAITVDPAVREPARRALDRMLAYV